MVYFGQTCKELLTNKTPYKTHETLLSRLAQKFIRVKKPTRPTTQQ